MTTNLQLAQIVQHLKIFGCSAGDSAVYLMCLQSGPATVQEIARKVKRNRVTVHGAIERLKDRGLLTETRRAKRRLIVAEEPSVLRSLLQKKYNDLKSFEGNLDLTISTLQSFQTHAQSTPSVRFYEGVEGFKSMLEETLSAKGEVLVYSNVDRLAKIVNPDYLEDYFLRRAKKKISTRLIFPPCSFAERVSKKSKAYRIKIRLLPKELQWRSAIFSWNNCISIKSFTEGSLTCTIIENDDIAHFFRNIIFELSWMNGQQI